MHHPTLMQGVLGGLCWGYAVYWGPLWFIYLFVRRISQNVVDRL